MGSFEDYRHRRAQARREAMRLRRELLEALDWIDAYERAGGRVICDGRMFAITPPAEADAPVMSAEFLGPLMEAAMFRAARA